MKIYDCAEAGLSAIPTDVPNDALALGLSKNALKDSLKRSSWGGMVCSGGDATDNCAQYTAKGTCEAGPCVNGGAGAPAAGCNAGKCTWGSTAAVMGRTAGLLQLDLSGNSLTALEADALQNLPKLVRLDRDPGMFLMRDGSLGHGLGSLGESTADLTADLELPSVEELTA